MLSFSYKKNYNVIIALLLYSQTFITHFKVVICIVFNFSIIFILICRKQKHLVFNC